jgi:hypothetical protein
MPDIRCLIEDWNELTELLDNLGVERMLEQQLPPGQRHAADKLHRLLFEISQFVLDADIDDRLETIESMLEKSEGGTGDGLSIFGQ